MKQFEQVLSESELLDIYRSFEESGEDYHRIQLMRAAVGAALTKLAEQEPVAWRVTAKSFCGDTTKHKDTAEYWEEKEPGCVIPLYAHPMPRGQVNLDSSNHIPDTGKMVAEMYWINPDYPSSDSIIEAFEPITSSVEVNVGDRYEVSRAIRLPDMTVEVTELEENGDVKAYKVVGGDHIPDASKKIAPEGYTLVPVEITAGMLRDAHIRSELGAYAVSNLSEGYSLIRNLYDVLVAAAPKFGENEHD